MQPRELHRPPSRRAHTCKVVSCVVCATLFVVVYCSAPAASAPVLQAHLRSQDNHEGSAVVPAGAVGPVCGDGKCEEPETVSSCFADCPGVTTPPTCGEEPHSDPGGHAVVWGASHLKKTAAECCEACASHAANQKNSKKPCNSWVFCNTYPQCWALDTGNWHGFGECW